MNYYFPLPKPGERERVLILKRNGGQDYWLL
jgi:hypothetical protein